MRLSRFDSVVKRKDQKIRNKYKGKKKHKKLDAIYEKGYNKSHRGVHKVESSEFINEENEHELRRSTRVRKAPVLLDSSPLPPTKRRKVDNGVGSSVEKVRRVDRAQCEMPCSSSSDGERDGWTPRLRSRQESGCSPGRGRGPSSLKGKRKLFQDLDRLQDEQEPQFLMKKEPLVGEKSTVVKSNRPGRIKASNVLENDNQDDDLEGESEDDLEGESEDGKPKYRDKILEVINELEGAEGSSGESEDGKPKNRDKILEVINGAEGAEGSSGESEDGKPKNRDKILEVINEAEGAEGLSLECRLECTTEIEIDCNMASQLAQGEETVIEETAIEECNSNGNVETRVEQVELEKLACDIVPGQVNATEFDCGSADQTKDDENLEKPLENDIDIKPEGRYYPAAVTDRKPKIKLGRRCGLCGGGTDGKPPKILLLEGAGSDNEVYSGSSASEEPNYDVCDGFGDQSGWLGKLLGPINDRFGIAGIWVHQQCAVWSPEVCFTF